ncbi:MAG: hypothetical protein ACI4DP_02860 [Candidatus Ornithomonoglobus sp.]
MKFFETPEMNITMFDVENIVTESAGDTPKINAEEAAQTLLTNVAGISAENTIKITF